MGALREHEEDDWSAGGHFLAKNVGNLKGTEYEELPDNVSAFVKPKNDIKCAFIVDMRNLNNQPKVKLRRVMLPSVQSVFQTIKWGISRAKKLWESRWTSPTSIGACNYHHCIEDYFVFMGCISIAYPLGGNSHQC